MTATTGALLPVVADRQRPWDSAEAESRVRAWASSGDQVDWRRYARAFLWYDGSAPDPDHDGLPDRFGDYKLPIADVIDGKLQAVPRGIFAAAAAVSGAQGGVDIPDADRAKVKAVLDRYYAELAKVLKDDSIVSPWGAEANDGDTEGAGDTDADDMGRAAAAGRLRVRAFAGRAYLLQDCHVRADGDGRTVEAYAAAFNRPAEIYDEDGHYHEVIAPRSFDKTIADNGVRFGVFYNHARTIDGAPSGSLSVPIGVPVEPPRADEHGVFTVTRYLDNPLADTVLDAVKQRALTAQSFSGRFIKSTRSRAAARGELPTITRHEIAMREYGPAAFAAYTAAHIVGTRSADAFLTFLAGMDPAARAEMLHQMLASTTPPGAGGAPLATTSPVAGHADEPPRHSARQSDIARRARVARILRGAPA